MLFLYSEDTGSFACDGSVRGVVVVQNVQLMLWSLKILLRCTFTFSLMPSTYGRLILTGAICATSPTQKTASLYFYHFSTVIDFSSAKYSGSTGHRNSWYQWRNFQ